MRINNLTLSIDEPIDSLKEKVAKKLKISASEFQKFKIIRESIDARKKGSIKFNYSVEVKLLKEESIVKRLHDKDIIIEKEDKKEEFQYGSKKLLHRPVIVGMGPAGMFAGLLLAQNGYKPLILERGEAVENRTEAVQKFWKTGVLNKESNVQFGEGGAGTFSDGKLTTRIKDNRCDYVIEKFVRFGAPQEIAYEGKPHIGTDVLKNVVKNLRNDIIKLGGEVLFNSKLEDITIENKEICAITVNGQLIPCKALILAIGHSSRDTYEMLHNRSILMEAKPFAIGVRVEHPQFLINESQYGAFAEHPRLKAADYRLAHTVQSNKRGVYSFCMCPGGEVVAAASEENRLVTNGMSNYRRDGKNANSALVVTVSPEDFKNESYKFNTERNLNYPLLGMEMQRFYEEAAFNLGGGEYIAPVQLLGDFLTNKQSKKLGSVAPSYKPGYEFRSLSECLPDYVITSLKEGIVAFDKKIHGYAKDDAVLTGVETRTSAPVKILRNAELQSVSVKGLYPSGEGAGFAGGIISAAVDGLKCAEEIMKEYKPLD